MGSPGTRWIRANTTMLTPSMTRTAWPSRRTTYPVTGSALDPGVGEADGLVRPDGDALHPPLRRHHVARVVEIDVAGVVHDQPGGLVVELLALLRSDLRRAPVEQLVDLRVRIALVVGLLPAVVLGVVEVVGVEVAEPAEQEG